MTFVEIHAGESESALEKLIAAAYTSTYHETSPVIHLGQTICWKGRMFREVRLSCGASALLAEDLIFHAAMMPHDRARIMIGSMQGKVFITPPIGDAELEARFIERGLCRPEVTIKPFHYSAYDPEES